MKKILLLTDYNNDFLITINNENKYISMDVNKIKALFESKGYKVIVSNYSNFNLKNNYKGWYILYQTSEVIGQFYKRYIEDIIYFLELNGAHVLPKYSYLKAHHNKGFMELLRLNFEDEELKTVESSYYGSSVEAQEGEIALPVVIKQNSGSGSVGVYRATTRADYFKFTNEASNVIITSGYQSWIRNSIKNLIKKIALKVKKNAFILDKKPFRPIVVQNFIEGLAGDYKVLYFGGKYYTLYRENREGDFRASGGGNLHSVKMEDNYPLLDFAKKVVDEIDFPIIGMDIGFDGNKYHLIEFQMMHLGPYTLNSSEYYFVRRENNWLCIEGKSNLEEEFTRSIYEYIENTQN